MELSHEVLAFRGKDPFPSKICLNNKSIERVNSFSYLGHSISFAHDTDIQTKLLNL
jgi:hypothetical protein